MLVLLVVADFVYFNHEAFSTFVELLSLPEGVFVPSPDGEANP